MNVSFTGRIPCAGPIPGHAGQELLLHPVVLLLRGPEWSAMIITIIADVIQSIDRSSNCSNSKSRMMMSSWNQHTFIFCCSPAKISKNITPYSDSLLTKKKYFLTKKRFLIFNWPNLYFIQIGKLGQKITLLCLLCGQFSMVALCLDSGSMPLWHDHTLWFFCFYEFFRSHSFRNDRRGNDVVPLSDHLCLSF